MSKRISKRQLKEDEVLTGLERAYLFVVEHQREFGIAAGSIVAVALVVMLGMSYRQRRHDAASHLLSKAFVIYEAPVLGDASTPARPGAKTYPSRADKLREALPAFDAVRQQYWTTPSGKVATYYVALCHIGLGDAEQGAQALDSLKDDPDALVAGLTRLTFASVVRDKLEPARAADLLQDKRYAYPADAAMFFHGLALEDQAKRSAAVEMYRNLQKTYTESPWREAAREREEALAGTPDGPSGEKGSAS